MVQHTLTFQLEANNFEGVPRLDPSPWSSKACIDNTIYMHIALRVGASSFVVVAAISP